MKKIVALFTVISCIFICSCNNNSIPKNDTSETNLTETIRITEETEVTTLTETTQIVKETESLISYTVQEASSIVVDCFKSHLLNPQSLQIHSMKYFSNPSKKTCTAELLKYSYLQKWATNFDYIFVVDYSAENRMGGHTRDTIALCVTDRSCSSYQFESWKSDAYKDIYDGTEYVRTFLLYGGIYSYCNEGEINLH